ncbi:unnamed protein product [Symbiodinium natans]|uniref:Uncharacterized protein n=1 Tax=Symbiodinium natans TaxID=878477 RepID=A0A812K945_9DINO|nr:unnamed protein product [Symbiodinium natans]
MEPEEDFRICSADEEAVDNLAQSSQIPTGMIGPDSTNAGAQVVIPSSSGTSSLEDLEAATAILTQRSLFRPDLMRGVSLRSTLRQGGWLWLYSPSVLSFEKRKQVFATSKPTERFDKFLSHTWWTHGKWKMLSLLIHFGWPTMLIAWTLGITLSFVLSFMGVLPACTSFEVHAIEFHGQVPYGCWIMLTGLMAPIAGLMAFPYLPRLHGSDTCFLDFVCINQTDTDEMQQGIRCIGHFLAATAELRVLWSAPYLSRLWCVFELAAYRKMNPSGTIVITPISNELLACKCFLWVNLFTFVFWFSRGGPEGGGGVRLLAVFLCVFCVMFPSLAHVAWKQKLDRDKLDSDLATFDVLKVECSNDFDRQCIHDAIIQWYGSLAAFSAHVQGPFHQEVVRLMRAGGSVPVAYVWFSLSPIFCLSLEGFVALWRANAPMESVLGWALSHLLAHDVLYLPAIGILYHFTTRCDLRSWTCGCKSFALESFLGAISFCVLFTGGSMVTVFVASHNFGLVLVWTVAALAVAGFCWGYCWRIL